MRNYRTLDWLNAIVLGNECNLVYESRYRCGNVFNFTLKGADMRETELKPFIDMAEDILEDYARAYSEMDKESLAKYIRNKFEQMQGEKHLQDIGFLTFFCKDLNETISIHEYLKRLLLTLWKEQDEFSGKRPFGNSGWDYDLMACLIAHNKILGSIDEDGYIEDCDYHTGDITIREYIKEM